MSSANRTAVGAPAPTQLVRPPGGAGDALLMLEVAPAIPAAVRSQVLRGSQTKQERITRASRRAIRDIAEPWSQGPGSSGCMAVLSWWSDLSA